MVEEEQKINGTFGTEIYESLKNGGSSQVGQKTIGQNGVIYLEREKIESFVYY